MAPPSLAGARLYKCGVTLCVFDLAITACVNETHIHNLIGYIDANKEVFIVR